MKTKTKSRTNLMRKVFSFLAVVVVLAMTFAVPAMAATDAPEASAQEMVNKTIDNATNVINIIIRFIGVIIFLWGLALFCFALNSHDAAQKMQGAVALFSGVLVFVGPWLLQMIID